MKAGSDNPLRSQIEQMLSRNTAASGAAGPDALLTRAGAQHQAGELGRAEALCREILQASPGHPGALQLLGVIACQTGQYAVALELLDRVIRGKPAYAEAWFSRGNALYLLQQYQAAAESYFNAIRLNPRHAEACNNRGSALQALGQYQAALESYDKALRLKPDYAEAHSNRGNALYALKLHRAAFESCERALALDVDHAQAWNVRGNALLALAQPEAALESFDRAILLDPEFADAHINRGNALQAMRRHQEAVESYDRALYLNPAQAEAHCNRGSALQALEQYETALESYERAIQLKPDFAEAHCNRGSALQAMKQYEAALESYDQAIALNPEHAPARNNPGSALYALERYEEALGNYDKAIALNPEFAEAHRNRGIVLQAMKRYEAAVKSFDRALEMNPLDAEAHNNRGSALQAISEYKAALESYDKAFASRPDYEYLAGTRLHMRMFLCDWDGIEDECARLEARVARGEKAALPFTILAISDSPALQRRAAEIFARDKAAPRPDDAPMARRASRAGQKIRIGYFSADFHNHATSYLMAEIFEQHDRSRFKIVAFSFGPDADDGMRQRVASAMDRFVDVRAMPDREVAELSRSLGIDIAVDLKGFTRDGRPAIFAGRAAPIQVNYLGYPGTMGVEYMDYLIADRTLIPDGARQHYSEKIVRTPDSYQANDSRRAIAEKPCARAGEGLPETGFVYCCFNRAYKITPTVFDLWMRVLGRVEGSVLWLFEENASARDNLRKEAARRGVAAQRLVFAQGLPLAEHLARQRLADLFLDTLPYNAHTTASDALWASVPVLTRIGESFPGRVAASLLRSVGMDELVTSTEEEYEELAVALGNDPTRLRALRSRLEESRRSAALFDSQAFTRHLESAYIKMIERLDAGLAPEHIDVPRLRS